MSNIAMIIKEPIIRQRLLLKEEGLYGGTSLLNYISIPEGVAIEEPEFQFLANLILKGWESQLLVEFAELALEGLIPSELSRKKLSIWLNWFATEVTFGY